VTTTGHGAGPAQTPIAIIGMGCLFPNASNLTEFWRTLRNGEDGITEVPPTHWSPADYYDPDPKRPDHTYCRRGGFLSPVAFDPTEFGIPPTILEATDTAQLLSLTVAKAALEDSGYGEERDFNRERVGVVLGITGTQELVIPLAARLGHPLWRRALTEEGVPAEVAERAVQRIADGYVSWQENSFPGLLGNVVAGRIANRLNLRGTNCVIDAACASSLAAVHLAMLELGAGRCDMALTGGADTLNDIFMHMCFSKTPALSPTGDARPFDADADGTVLGEGIGMLVLKRLADAQRDGDRIYAVIRAIGTSSDGRSQSIYAPHAGGQARALRNAYQLAGFEPDTVELIEAHGTGTKVGDAAEFEAIRTVFREARSDGTWCAIGSVKSQIGHTKAAAGAAGLIKAALAIYHRAIPPTIKVKSPNPKLEIGESPFYLATQQRPWLTERSRLRRAGVSSFGFGGSNFHAVLEEHHAAIPVPAWDGSVQIIALSAESLDGLRAESRRFEEEARRADWTSAHLAYRAAESRKTFSASHVHRLVVVHQARDDLAEGLAKTAETLTGSKDAANRQFANAFYGTGPRAGRLAFLYPGQGSQYVGMGRDLVCSFPELQAVIEEAQGDDDNDQPRLVDLLYPWPVFNEADRAAQSAALTRTEVAQPAIGAISLGFTRILERFGLRPDLVGGHSYGELVALCVAGRYDAATLHALTRLRGRLMAVGDADRGTMLAVKTPLADLQRLVEEEGLGVVIANRNAPSQGILSGPRPEIARAAELCKARGWAASPLNVAGAFHSPMMEEALSPFRLALEAAAFTDGRAPVYANATGREYPQDPAAAKKLLARQLVSAVEFVGQIEAMYQSGARTFLEIGPKSVLTGLVGAILSGKPHQAISLDDSNGRGEGVVDLARVLAQLAAHGHNVELVGWERPCNEPRTPRMAIPLVGANYRAASPPIATSIVETPPLNASAREPRPDQSAQRQQSPPPSAEPIDPHDAPTRIAKSSAGTDGDDNRSAALAEALQSVRAGLRSMQALQEQTAAAHQRFLEGQQQAHQMLLQLMETQHRLLGGTRGMTLPELPTVAAAPVLTPLPAPNPTSPPPAQVPIERPPARREEPTPTKKDPAPSGDRTELAAPSPDGLEPLLLDVVCEKTGYPREMVHLEMDIEADLGIDSIKRVEIIAALEERAPDLPGVKPDQMGSLRTLRQIVDFMGAGSRSTAASPGAPAASAKPVSIASPPSAGSSFATTLLTVVSELTGYPQEMLNLDMDLEADLGIDSIKRVEILAGVESRIADLPPVKPEHMGSMRTLAQIVEFYGSHSAKPDTAPTSSRPASSPTPAPASPSPTPLARGVLKLVDLVPTERNELLLAPEQEVWINDDDPGLANEIEAQLVARGQSARVVRLDRIQELDDDATVAGLILIAPALNGDSLPWPEESHSFLRAAFGAAHLLGRRLQKAAMHGGACLVTVSQMDGAFGMIGGDFDAVRGGLSGLAKTASQEWPEVRCLALDLSARWSDTEAKATAVLNELRSEGPIEVGLDLGRRRGLEVVPSQASVGPIKLVEDDLVVITGGARGVTAVAAEALARRCRPRIVLIGRSPSQAEEPGWLAGLTDDAAIKQAILRNELRGEDRASPTRLKASFDRHMAARQARQTLSRIASLGAKVTYECLDIRDAAAVRGVMDRLRRTWGPIRAIIHGAGVLEDKLIVDKSLQQFDRVVETKLRGLRNLLASAPLDDLKLVALFSSVSARFGNAGQADYAMANEALNKIAHRLAARLPQARVVSLNWGPWDGGMVTEPLKREFARRGVELIPPAAGAEAFVEELRGDDSAVEIVLGAALPDPGRTPLRPAYSRRSASREHALSVVFERQLNLDRHPFLASHQLAGRPVLPVAMMIEWMGHAALHANPGLGFLGLDDLRVFSGVSLDSGSIHLELAAGGARRSGDGFTVDVELRGRQIAGGNLTRHAKTTVVLTASRPEPPNPARFDGLMSNPYPRSIDEVYAEVLFHGEHLRAIRTVLGWSPRGMVASLGTAPPPRQWMVEPLRGRWIADPLVMDGAFQLAILWCVECLGAPSLPVHIAQYRQYRNAYPAEGVACVLEVAESSSHKVVADMTFLDPQDNVVAELKGYQCVLDASLRAAFRGETRLNHVH